MSPEIKASQFVYGKLVGNNHEYRLVAWTSDLDRHKESLRDLVETGYHHFSGTQGNKGDTKAVGICPNSTGILSEKETLLIQTSTAVSEEGKLLTNGSRPFIQHRFIFIDQKSLNNFNNCVGLLLSNLLKERIPCFERHPVNDEWATLSSKVFSLSTPISNEEQSKNFLSQQPLFRKALSLVLDRRSLIITNDKNSHIRHLNFLDNLLQLLPLGYRRTLKIAFGALDEKYCGWADLIVKNNGSPSVSDRQVWVERNECQFYPSYDDTIEHKYIRNFISVPIENKWIKASDILNYLDTSEDQNFDLNRPSLKFILDYPMASEYYKDWAASVLHEYLIEPDNQDQHQGWQDFKSQCQNFINDDNNTIANIYLSVFWQALRKDTSCSDLVSSLVAKILHLGDTLFAEIVTDPLFINHLPNLLKNKILQGFDRSKYSTDVLQRIKDVFLTILKVQQTDNDKLILVSILANHKNLFAGGEILDLLTSILTTDNFKKIFTNQIVDYLPSLTNFSETSLYLYLSSNLPIIAQDLLLLLHLRQNGGLQRLPDIAESIKIDNVETEKLYLTFIKSWKLRYDQSISLVASAIGRSVEQQNFRIDPFLEIYEYFKRESNLLSILNEFRPDTWLSWYRLSSNLYKDNKESMTIFLDINVSKYYCADMLKQWLELLNNSQQNTSLEQKFLHANIWNYLTFDNLKSAQYDLQNDLISNYPEYIPKLVRWAYRKQRLDLISGILIDCLKTIWVNQKHLDKHLWELLTNQSMLDTFGIQYWLKLFLINLKTGAYLPIPQPQRPISEKDIINLSNDLKLIIYNLNDSYNIDEVLQSGERLSLNPLSLLCEANPESCDLKLMSKYLTRTGKIDEYYVRCIEVLSRISSSSEIEKNEKMELTHSFAQRAIEEFPQEELKKVSKRLLECLSKQSIQPIQLYRR